VRSGRYAIALLSAILALAVLPVRAADVTEVPEGVSTEAVKAFRSGLVLHKEKQYAAATVPVTLLAARFETMEIIWSGQFIAALAWLVLGLSVGAISLLYLLIRRGAVSKLASYFFMVPPTTALIAWAMFGEHLGPVAVAGMAVAVLGVALVQRG